VPVTYVYGAGRVYGHTNDGLKIRIMREKPLVCFQVDDIQDMDKWRSVIAWGRFEELHGEAAAKALDLLISRLAPSVASSTSLPEKGDVMEEVSKRIRLRPSKGVVYSIALSEKTGRFERP